MKRNGLFVVVLLLLAGVAAFSGYKMYAILAEYRAGEDAAQSMQQYIIMQPETSETVPDITEAAVSTVRDPEIPQSTEPAETAESTEPAEPSPAFPVVDFEALQKINPDVLGWICIEGTNINYPIVQGVDNDYYLSHLVDGTANGAGSIFLDYRNEPDFSDYHTIIYGHNMKNDTMFAQITEYKKAEFYEAHPTVMLLTPQENFRMEVIGGYVADLRDPAWELHFETEEARQDWLRDAMRRSTVGGDYVSEGGEKIITLSTCSYEFDDARFVLICRKLETSDGEK